MVTGFTWVFILSYLILSSSGMLPAAETTAGLPDDELLDLIQQKAFNYFVTERNPTNGLIHDRAHNFVRGGTKSPASIASVGFGLTAFPVGVERGWLSHDAAYQMTYRTLLFFLKQAPQEHGFFYHFLNMDSGARSSKSELSPIDTALFLAGALFAAEYFDDQELRRMADEIYKRVDWQWMLHGGETLALAWSPESGFSKRRWDHYDESMIMYLLAIGSPTHPIPAESWKAIARPIGSYKEYRLIQMPPLFTHQYSHIWIDFRNKNDGFADYFVNSVNATLANRAFCIDQSSQFVSYGPNSWGLTASDGPFGYRAYGAPPGWAQNDGTVAPTACGSSIVFTPKESIACLRHFYEELGDDLWGIYGFSDSFNLDKDWFSHDVIGIDEGALVLMIENYRSGLIWDVMKKNTYLQDAMKKVGFREGTMELPEPKERIFNAPYVPGGITVDGYLKDWTDADAIVLDKSFRELGSIEDDKDLSAQIRFAWDENALYFTASVTDQDVVLKHTGRNIWRDDLLEIYIDPDGDGLYWSGAHDFQIGFRPKEGEETVETWSWFQGGEDPQESNMVTAAGYVHEEGYVLEGAIRWTFLDFQPGAGKELRISPAVHDVDRDRTEAKVQWHFFNEGEAQRFTLGRLVLKSADETIPKSQAAAKEPF